MARNEQDREDLLREATALVERIEFELPGSDETIVVGFRRDGSASFFLGVDPVFQFNSGHQLRRAYVDGKLLKAERGGLVALERRRTASQVELLRTELDEAACAVVLENAQSRLRAIAGHLRDGTCRAVGQVPESADVTGRLQRWLADCPQPLQVAARPHAG